jgi:hypothetical protein
MTAVTRTVTVETDEAVYIVDAEVYEFVVAMHPDAFSSDSIRAMANSLIVLDKKSGKVIKARSFSPR